MKIGIVATRLAGVDGVTFETAKWEAVLDGMGHELRLCAGEVDALRYQARLVPPMHFSYPPAARVTAAAFDAGSDPTAVRAEIDRLADLLLPVLRDWANLHALDALVVENAWAIPMHLPLGVALRRLVEELQAADHRPSPRLLVGARAVRHLRRARGARGGVPARPAVGEARDHQQPGGACAP